MILTRAGNLCAAATVCYVDFLQNNGVGFLHNMGRLRREPRVEVMRGTLDLMILRTLLPGPSHGHAIAKHIQRTTDDLLQVETGSLYPALYRLEADGYVAATWDKSEKGKRARYYRMTPKGRKQLAAEQSKWDSLVRAMGNLLKPIAGEDA